MQQQYAAPQAEAAYQFQSPRSGKFVSDTVLKNGVAGFRSKTFQSPRSGKFVSDVIVLLLLVENILTTFQSPRSGKFVSDFFKGEHMNFIEETFQSPRSGKFVSDNFYFLQRIKNVKFVSIP